MRLWHNDPRQRSLLRATREFQSLDAGSVILRYDPDIDSLEISLFRLACIQQARAVEKLFGARLQRWWFFPQRLSVYVFQSASDITPIYGASVGGYASWYHWLITVSLESNWGEILRHELAHIIGGRWNPQAPTVLCEGLAVWAQRTYHDGPLDECVRFAFSDQATASAFLLSPAPAVGSPERHRYYAVVGSFSAAVIRRFGLARYQNFYKDRAITEATLARRFKRPFWDCTVFRGTAMAE